MTVEKFLYQDGTISHQWRVFYQQNFFVHVRNFCLFKTCGSLSLISWSCLDKFLYWSFHVHLKDQLGWNTSGPPSALVCEGEYITKPKEIAENLSKFFEAKIDKLKESIPASNLDHVETLRKVYGNLGACPRSSNSEMLH